MPTLGIQRSTWDGLANNQRQLMRWAFRKLALGTPAVYETPGLVEWYIFDDTRLDLLMFARLGTLANLVSGLPGGWTPPTIIGVDENGDPFDTGIVDRQAVEDEAISRVQASIVLPEDITYPEDDPNPQQTTLDANSAPAAMQGGGAVPATWNPVSGP